MAANSVCGGLIIEDSLLVFRHAIPLLHLDWNELESPLEIVFWAANYLEQALTGSRSEPDA
jgi:hypothetical protein